MQLEKRKITMRQCAYEALVNEGPYSLYKGLAQPLIGAVPINIITFTVNDYVKLFLSKHTEIQSPVTQTLYGGALAGLASLSIYVPLDLLKCRA